MPLSCMVRGGEEEEGVAAPRRPALCSVLSGAYSMEVIQPISRMELSRHVGGVADVVERLKRSF